MLGPLRALPAPSHAAGSTPSRAAPMGLSAARPPAPDSRWQLSALSTATKAVASAAALSALAAGLRGQRLRRQRQAAGCGRTRLASIGNWPKGAAIFASADEVLRDVKWPDSWPYTSEDLTRADESDDRNFYNEPRLCTHIDDGSIDSLKNYYAEVFPTYADARILDICSSHISHYPEQKCWSRVSVTGMNEYELSRNVQADDYVVQNLNDQPELPFQTASFDVVTCTVSFDYLCKPLEVMREVGRVLKPGGSVILSTSNRCFPTKAVNIWLRTNDMEHILIYGSYIHFSGAFEPPEARDISAPLGRVGLGDPMYVIQARKKVA